MHEIHRKGEGSRISGGFQAHSPFCGSARQDPSARISSDVGLEAIPNRCVQHSIIFVKVIYPASREPQ